jgi:hypothetical protein
MQSSQLLESEANGISDGELGRIFHPYIFHRLDVASERKIRFVYYTTAKTAYSIITKRVVWLRNASCMNDYMEAQYGLELLISTFRSNKKLFVEVFDKIFDDFTDSVTTLFDKWANILKFGTYIMCFSEHEDSEDANGRLSMWRAYGGAAGVALVLNPRPMIVPASDYGAETTPVAYLTDSQFEQQFRTTLESVKLNHSVIQKAGKERVITMVFHWFRYAMLCVKHPGFAEEREWRIIYTPSLNPEDTIFEDVEIIDEVPQIICKIKLQDIPKRNLYGVEPDVLLNRIIVGPSKFPYRIRESLEKALALADVSEPAKRIVVSEIPLRT